MGNQLLKVHNLDKETEQEGGRYLRWKLVQGSHKERPHQPVTLFLFDKKLLDRYEKSSVRDALLDSLRADASKLQKLRHPNLLHILEPLSEERLSLAFATKPVLATLHQYIQVACNKATCYSGGATGKQQMPSAGRVEAKKTQWTSEERIMTTQQQQQPQPQQPLRTTWKPMCMLEKKCGLLDIAEAIAFLHQDAKLIHRNINAHSVFITTQGKWLLGGLGYSRPKPEGVTSSAECEFTFSSSGTSFHDVGGVALDPPLPSAAPEMTKSFPGRCNAASDMYSFGLLIYELLAESPLLNVAPYDVQSHCSQCRSAIPLRTDAIPSTLYSALTGLLNFDPAVRPTIEGFLQTPFFEDINVRALRFLETLREKEDSQKIQFLQGLTRLLDENEDFDDVRLLRERVLSPLLDMLQYSNLYPYVLPNLFVVLQKVTDTQHFQDAVWPMFKPLLTAKEIQIEAVLTIIKELDFLLSLSTDAMITDHFLPLILKCLELHQAHIQEMVLTKLAILSKRFDYAVLRNNVLPRLLNLLYNTDSSQIRIRGLETVTLLSSSFDRTTLLEQLVPAVEKTNRVDRSPAVCMAVVRCLESVAKTLGPKISTERILPVMVPLLVEESLTAEQFSSILGVTRNMLQKLQDSRATGFRIATENTTAVKEALGAPNSTGDSFEALLQPNSTAKTTNPSSCVPPRPPPPPPATSVPISSWSTLASASTKNASSVSRNHSNTRSVQKSAHFYTGPLLSPLPKLLCELQPSLAPASKQPIATTSKSTYNAVSTSPFTKPPTNPADKERQRDNLSDLFSFPSIPAPPHKDGTSLNLDLLTSLDLSANSFSGPAPSGDKQVASSNLGSLGDPFAELAPTPSPTQTLGTFPQLQSRFAPLTGLSGLSQSFASTSVSTHPTSTSQANGTNTSSNASLDALFAGVVPSGFSQPFRGTNSTGATISQSANSVTGNAALWANMDILK